MKIDSTINTMRCLASQRLNTSSCFMRWMKSLLLHLGWAEKGGGGGVKQKNRFHVTDEGAFGRMQAEGGDTVSHHGSGVQLFIGNTKRNIVLQDMPVVLN